MILSDLVEYEEGRLYFCGNGLCALGVPGGAAADGAAAAVVAGTPAGAAALEAIAGTASDAATV